MVARILGASLGLLAFTITIIAGLYVQNPVTVTLARGILALFVFCVIGLVLGGAAQLIVNEHEREGAKEIREKYREGLVETDAAASGEEAIEEPTAPMET